MEQIIGYVESVTFVSEETGFTVAKLKEPKKRNLTSIVGVLPSIQPGETLQCEGRWKTHSSFGIQFEVASYQVRTPSDLVGIQKYLESGLVKGIGPVYAKNIVAAFGLETLHIIDTHPDRLSEVPQIGKKRIQKIKECWSDQKAIREVMVFLRTFDISPTFAHKIFKTYGDKSIATVKKNPYILARDIHGIGFKSADGVAIKMGFAKDSPLRIEAGIEYVLWKLTEEGHVCYPKEHLLEATHTILEVEKEKISLGLEKTIQEKRTICDQIPGEEYSSFIWVPTLYFSEKSITKEVFRLKSLPSPLRKIDSAKALDWVEKRLNIQLAEEQKEAVKGGITGKVQIITGGPGTGKSTITNAILAITEKISSHIILAAPTGKAAKRMTQITGKKASTIHALLEYDFSCGGFKRNAENPLKCDLLIIDEASMIDTFLMHHLLKAIPSGCRLILVGDIDQLPSVGPGNVLKDIIESNQVTVITLKKIFRQAQHSHIISNAHKINAGEIPSLKNPSWSDFHFIECEETEDIENEILSLVSKRLPQAKKMDPLDDIQVLCPMKRGRAGTESLNIALQNTLNPSTTPLFIGGRRFHVHDKVMQIRNNYDKHIYNGDVGRIQKIDVVDQTLSIRYDEKTVDYDYSELEEITLAYAVSVHKYQGSECPCVIIPVHISHFKLLFRNLLYTAVTRGKKLVILVGSKKAIAVAVKNHQVQRRYTGLKTFLQKERNSFSALEQPQLPGLIFS